MPIHPCGAAFPQDLHCSLGALVVGSDQDELAIVIKRRGVGLDQTAHSRRFAETNGHFNISRKADCAQRIRNPPFNLARLSI